LVDDDEACVAMREPSPLLPPGQKLLWDRRADSLRPNDEAPPLLMDNWRSLASLRLST